MLKKPRVALKCKILAALATLAVVGLAASPVPAGASTRSKTVSFTATYSGKASLLINNSTVTISSIAGSGKNSLFGSSKVAGNGSAPKSGSSLCDPFGGKGSISGGTSKITFVVAPRAPSRGAPAGRAAP